MCSETGTMSSFTTVVLNYVMSHTGNTSECATRGLLRSIYSLYAE